MNKSRFKIADRIQISCSSPSDMRGLKGTITEVIKPGDKKGLSHEFYYFFDLDKPYSNTVGRKAFTNVGRAESEITLIK